MDSIRPARQPIRDIWPKTRLVHERAVALGNDMDRSTLSNYSSALNSYISFVKSHDFPMEPTPETLSFYTVYMCHYLNPRSVNTYLSGISQQLEPYFPSVRDARNSNIVRRTLRGCMRTRGSPTVRKRALTIEDLHMVVNHYHNSPSHNDKLFVAMLLSGFFGLLRLGELTFPNDSKLHNWKKVTRRNTVVISDSQYEFFLPGHKADRFFEGNRIIILAQRFGHQPLHHFSQYLESRDRLHPIASALWLTEEGLVPTRSFFISRLNLFFDKTISGQSMRAGGATALAEHGVPPSLIQAAGRWASDAFLIYIRKNPTLLQAFLFAHPSSHT
jgi:hypothetical protein